MIRIYHLTLFFESFCKIVNIAMQCYENFGGGNAHNAPHGCAPGSKPTKAPPWRRDCVRYPQQATVRYRNNYNHWKMLGVVLDNNKLFFVFQP